LIKSKRTLSLASLVILMLCLTLHFAIGQQPSAWRPVFDGQCGTANGVAVGAAPTALLCAFGTASAVTGSGPWTWRCNGFLGGSSASCSAPIRSAGGATTTAGVLLPTGWTLRQSDRFGTDGNVTNYSQLHAEYCEGQFYNVDNTGCLARPPTAACFAISRTVHTRPDRRS